MHLEIFFEIILFYFWGGRGVGFMTREHICMLILKQPRKCLKHYTRKFEINLK